MYFRNWFAVFGLMAVTAIVPCDLSAQSLGGSILPDGDLKQVDSGAGPTTMSIAPGARNLPIDAGRLYQQMEKLSVGGASVTRGARETQIYNALSPSVALVLTNEGLGSGSLLSEDGTILTNWHVVEGYSRVGVIFKPKIEGAKVTVDDAVFAEVVKIDEVADLALLKATTVPKHVKPIKLGSLDEVAVGSDVHAIGHPTGESWTYTRGFVSQFRRDYEWVTESGVEHRSNVVQTQTPINPGNSGGPLLSETGNLVGVNSFKSGGEGLNFAVAVDEVERFLEMEGSRGAKRVTQGNAVSSADCSDEPIATYRSEDNTSNIYLFDFDCDGEADTRGVEPDNKNEPAFASSDTNGDGKIDFVIVDEDRDGHPDYSLIDTTANGEPDLVGYYRVGEDEPYRVEKAS